MRISAVFRGALSPDDYILRQQHMLQQPLAHHAGSLLWCVYHTEQPTLVLATCQSIGRYALVKQGGAQAVRQQKIYCIASVVSHPEYRGCGAVRFLLKCLGRWFDGPGDVPVSVMYSTIEDFYIKIGWVPLHAPEISLVIDKDVLPVGSDISTSQLPQTTSLRADEMESLCARDIEAMSDEVAQISPAPGGTHVAILPTAELLSNTHARAEFISGKLYDGNVPRVKGVMCKNGGDSWLFWHHDFGRQCLFIQRLRSFVKDEEQKRQAIIALLQAAVIEAREWGFPKVSSWDTCADLDQAAKALSKEKGIEYEFQEKREETMSFRRKAGETGGLAKMVIYPNENYAWN